MKDKQQPFQDSRLKQRGKRRKTNIILNSLIVIVLLLIVIVSVQIFFKDDQKASTSEEQVENVTAQKESSEQSSDADKSDDKKDQQDDRNAAVTDDQDIEDEKESEDGKKEKNKEKDEKEKEDKDKKNSEDLEDSAVVTDGGNDPDVAKTIVNPEWDSVGTVQSGEHHSTYSGVDWDEMVQAISYATGIDEGNMTIHFLGNNGVNKSVGTVQAKDTKQKYRVYIEWVDEKGWKPTLVEELTE